MKRTFRSIATLSLASLVIVSCSPLNKMKKRAGEMGYKVTPEVLEEKGEMVDVKIDVTIPAKFFNKNVTVVATPVLKYQGGEKAFEPTTLQGENVQGNNVVVPYETGKTITYTGQIPFEDAMRISDLVVDIKASKGAKSVNFDGTKIAEGVIATATLVNNDPALALGKDNFQRITPEQNEAAIYYLINSSQIRNNQVKSEEIKAMEQFLKDAKADEDVNLKNIEIQSYASPDGTYDWNEKLANKREGSSDNFLKKNMKKNKMEEYKDLDFFKKYVVAEDWEGFKKAMEASSIRDKELILRVLSMYQDPEQRETEIKNISSVYKTLADEILPQLRRSRLTLNYEIIGKSDEEIANLAATDPKQLNVEEILYAATLTNDPAKKADIYTKASQQFPNDYRAFNNLGKLAYQAGDLDKAQSYVKKAESIKSAPEVNMNLGLIALAKGDKAAAESYLGKAAGAKELNETLGNLYVAQGQYERAVNAFGDTKTNSAALAQILAKDYNKAKNTLAGIATPDAYTDYLMAVLGARTNNTSMLTSSLKSAVAKNPALAKKAATDLEFAKYYTNADFMSIVK